MLDYYYKLIDKYKVGGYICYCGEINPIDWEHCPICHAKNKAYKKPPEKKKSYKWSKEMRARIGKPLVEYWKKKKICN